LHLSNAGTIFVILDLSDRRIANLPADVGSGGLIIIFVNCQQGLTFMKSLLVFTTFFIFSLLYAKPYRCKNAIPSNTTSVNYVIDTAVDPLQQSRSVTSCAAYYQKNQRKHIDELVTFLAIPSISSLAAHNSDMPHAAEWLAQKLKSIGMTSTEVIPTKGHPVVVSRWNNSKHKPTILIYGHYDVQPVKENEWTTNPFIARIDNNRIYARGAADDKGGLLIPVWAVEGMLQELGELPVNVTFIFDGEEEIGSPHFKQFLQEHRQFLQADFAYNADATQYNDSLPSIWMSLRGSASLEFTVKTAHSDAHSGVYGGKTPNAAKAAAQIISSFYDSDNKVAIQGFYDHVLPLTKEDRDRVKKVPYNETKDMKDIGSTMDIGEEAFSPLERIWYRPTLEVTGVWGGYTATEGFANIIPAAAHVRINCRLVANQNGKEIISLIKRHIAQRCPKGATVIYKDFESFAAPIRFPDTETSFRHAYDVLTRIYNRPPLLTAIGGSIAAMTHIKDVLGLYAYSFGFQQTDENFHAPDEFIRLSDIEKGQKAYCMLLMSLGSANK
jgi:acetylornithine deacetylase/succinyl-diaminopimelate desuccinylase-like protein